MGRNSEIKSWGLYCCGTERSQWIEIVNNRGRRIAKITCISDRDLTILETVVRGKSRRNERMKK